MSRQDQLTETTTKKLTISSKTYSKKTFRLMHQKKSKSNILKKKGRTISLQHCSLSPSLTSKKKSLTNFVFIPLSNRTNSLRIHVFIMLFIFFFKLIYHPVFHNEFKSTCTMNSNNFLVFYFFNDTHVFLALRLP